MITTGSARTIAPGYLALILLVLAPVAFSQSQPPAYTPDVGNVGLPANGVFSGGSVDTVQLNTGNLHIDIPLLHLPGIGLDTDIHLTYDSQVWNRAVGSESVNSPAPWTLITWSRAPWQTKDPLAGYLKWGYHNLNWNCSLIDGNLLHGAGEGNTDIDFMSFTDGNGTAHSLPVSGVLPTGYTPLCSVNGVVGTWPAMDTSGDLYNGYYPVYPADQSGYRVVLSATGNLIDPSFNVVNVSDKHGTKYTLASQPSGSASGLPAQLVGTGESYFGATGSILNPAGATNLEYLPITAVEDSDGNRITSNSNSSGVTITDTVGRAITETYTPQTSQCGASDVQYGQSIPAESLGNMPSSFQYLDQNKQLQSITVCYGVAQASLNLICGGATSCSTEVGVNNPSGSVGIVVPTSIILQNGDTYTFSYNPNGDPDYMGEITSITLPTGGTISYTYGDNISNTFSGRQLLSRSVTENGQTSTWNYNYAYNSLQVGGGGQPNYQFLTTTVTDPNMNDTVFTCNNNPTNLPVGEINWNASCYMTNEVSYNGRASSQNPIATKSTGYTVVGTSLGAFYYAPISDVLTWNSSNATTEADTTWDSYHPPTLPGMSTISFGNVMSKAVYDYGNGSHGALLKYTTNSYLHQNSSAYLTPNILDRVAQTSVYNSLTPSSSTLVAQTTTAYDVFTSGGQSGLASTGGGTTQHDYTNYGTGNSLRGLPTSVTKCTTTSCSASITAYMNYNDLGKETVATDARGNFTKFTYGAQGAFIASTTMPTTTTNGTTINHVVPQYQDPNTGLLIWKGTQNSSPSTGQVTPSSDATQYTYDYRMRVLTESRPDGGSTTNAYPDPNHTTSAVKEDAQRTATTTVTLDGLGRKISTGTTSDATCGPLTVDTGYDLLGRVQWVSNPHCASAQVTDGYTTYTYDAIGRLTNKQNPDASSQTWSMNGNIIDFYDETNRRWRHTYDAEDRLISVLEPDGSANLGITPTLETDYSYDTLGNLLQVDQWGGVHGSSGDHLRKFSYDATSRLLASNNPESASANTPASQTCAGTASGTKWTTCYSSYDGNGNLLQKTDNRGISIYYSYDNLNRVSTKAYSDSTPPVAYTYDASSITGNSNDIGQLTQATVSSGSTLLAQTNTYAYDPVGRLLNEQQCNTATNCASSPYKLAYTYDWAGKPVTTTFPSNAPGNGNQAGQPLTLTYSYDQAERLLTAASNWVASGDANHPGTLFQGSANSGLPAYGPMGLLNASMGFNSSNGATVATIQRGYDMRGRTVNGLYAAGGGAITDSRSAGSITISGNESAPVTKTAAPGSIVLSNLTGGLQFGSFPFGCYYPPGPGGQQYNGMAYHAGYVQVTIQSTPPFTVVANFGQSDENPSDLVSSIFSQLNGPGSPVTANSNTGTLTAKTTGLSTNYPVTVTQFQGVDQYPSDSPCGNGN
jgi:YD repeat-containing protein